MLCGSKDMMVRYAQTETMMSGMNSWYPPVSSAMRKIPVSGACITPLMSPAIPIMAKFFSCSVMFRQLFMFQILAKRNPEMHPRNRLGAKTPPHPPPPLVAVAANTLNISTSVR